MEENKVLNSESSEDVVDSSQDFIDTINTLKATTVSKEMYDKVREENRQLLNSLVNNQPFVNENQPTENPAETIKSLREELYGDVDLTNLAYVEKTLELRDLLMQQGEPDPFCPTGKNIVATEEDLRTAQRVAEALRQCVDYAQGDSEAFTNELQRITVDTGPKKYR